MRLSRVCAFLILILGITPAARADDICDYYRKHFPAVADGFCSGRSSSSSKGDGSHSGGGSKKSNLSANSNMNAASLPTAPTGYGLETILSMLRNEERSKGPQFSLIKGYQRVGAGITSGPGNSFYSNDVVQRELGPPDVKTFSSREEKASKFPSLAINTSFDLTPKAIGKVLKFKLGAGVRYESVTDSFGPRLGLQLMLPVVSFGIGASRDKPSSRYDAVYYSNLSLSLRIPFVELEYAVLDSHGGPRLKPIHILTLSLQIRRLLLTGAVRRLDYLPDGTRLQKHGGIQYLLFKFLSVGYMYNYIPGAHSAAFQIFI